MRRVLSRLAGATLVLLSAVITSHATSAVADGNERWESVDRQLGGLASEYQAVRTAGDGSIYVAGYASGGAFGLDYGTTLRKFDSSGSQIWVTNVTTTPVTEPPDLPELVVDGLGNPYVRVCTPQCRLAAYNPATGAEIDAISDPGIQNPWPAIGVASGGVLVVSRVDGMPPTLAARRLDPELDQLWSFDLTGTLDADESAGTWLVETETGAFWAVGSKIGNDYVTPMVQFGANGNNLGTLEQPLGGKPLDPLWSQRPMRHSPLAAGPDGHIWLTIDEPGDGDDEFRRTWSISSTSGARLGYVNLHPPVEQVPTSAGLATCLGIDRSVVEGDVSTSARFATRVLGAGRGSVLVTVMRCVPLEGGSPVSVMVAYSTRSPLGATYARQGALELPSTSKVFDMTTDDSGSLVVAGSVDTVSPLQWFLIPRLGPPLHCCIGQPHAALARNPTGNLLDPAELSAMTPARLFDTRSTEPHGLAVVPKLQITAGGELKVRLAGLAGVPTFGAGAVSLNVTVTNPTAAGYVTVHPCGPRPDASNLNYAAGQTVANAVIAPLSANGELCFYSRATTDLVADVNGWFRADNGFHPLTPLRVFDSRPSEPQGAVAITKQRYGGAQIVTLQAADVPGVESDAAALSLNITATQPGGAGYATVYPCGDRPLASNLNFAAGETVPNAVIAPVSGDGSVCFYASTDTHLIADINGYFDSSSSAATSTPVRLFDTRPGEPAGEVVVTEEPFEGGQLVRATIRAHAGLPVSALNIGAVSLNVTVSNTSDPGFVTVFPCGPRPLASTLNFARGQTVANAVVTPLSPADEILGGGGGELCFFSNVGVDLVVDMNGWFPP
jgi:hypothetical protein